LKYKLDKTNTFKRSFKELKLNNKEEMAYIDVIYNLLSGVKLTSNYKDHQLQGTLEEFRECHIQPDLLLIYKFENDVLKLVNIGTHGSLFK